MEGGNKKGDRLREQNRRKKESTHEAKEGGLHCKNKTKLYLKGSIEILFVNESVVKQPKSKHTHHVKSDR